MHTSEQLNTALAGRYAIDRLIGEGGMATVYLARDVKHNRRVALKVLKPDLGAVVGSERFLSEIQVTANLQHPNLLPLFDSGTADSLLFYVMPYVDGESLRARIQREKQLPVDEAVRLATSIASALDYAHRHGVIHRDLKPENILLHEGQPLVADFGIALAVSNAGGNRITQTGLSLGTPQYMSPEQATGDRVIDGRTDIYSLGAVVYEMLTGEPPHTGSTSQQVISRVLTDRPRAIRLERPSVPEHVEAAVDQALEKLPADRFATAREFSEALTGTRILTRTTVSGARARAVRRANAHLLAAWTVAVAALTTAALLSIRKPAAPPPAPPAQFEIKQLDSMRLGLVGSAAFLQISRDGSTLLFGAREGNAIQSLYVRRLDDPTIQRVRGTDSARGPVLSPSGTEVLFASPSIGSTSTLKRISLRGGIARTVVTDAPANGQASWIDDSSIVFVRSEGLWTVPADGGAPTRLAVPDTARRHLRYGFPDVLPGGRAALVTIGKGGTSLDSSVIGVVSIPGGVVTELGIHGTYPRYSGTGHIVFATSDALLNALPFDARDLRVTGPAFTVLEGIAVGTGGAASYSVALNGTLVYAAGEADAGDRPLMLVDRAGNSRQLIPQRGFYAYPRVSPDGKQVAVTVATNPGVGGNNPDIWRVDTTSKALMRVTTDSQSSRAVWLDNERIAHVGQAGDSIIVERQLYTGGNRKTIVRVPHVVADFAPGRPHGYGAFRTSTSATGAVRDIWLVHMDSLDAPRPFLAASYNEQAPAISPDGRLIAYVTDKTGRNEVYVQRLPGGGEVQVSIGGGIEPVWSREGGELFYRDPMHLMSAMVVDGPQITVSRRDTLFLDRGVYARQPLFSNYDVFPGGKYFVMFINRSSERQFRPMFVKMNWHVRNSGPSREP